MFVQFTESVFGKQLYEIIHTVAAECVRGVDQNIRRKSNRTEVTFLGRKIQTPVQILMLFQRTN